MKLQNQTDSTNLQYINTNMKVKRQLLFLNQFCKAFELAIQTDYTSSYIK